MKILMHICCAPCACYPVSRLEKDFEIHGFWFNPNIHPYQEYVKRMETVAKFAEAKGMHIIYKDEYKLEEFLRSVVFRENNRCNICYYIRLSATASIAKHGKFDYFTTSMLYSKYLKHDLVKEVAETVAKEYKVKFYYEDFRAGGKEGVKISKELGLYRQQYCGCIYSEKERFCPEKNGE